MSGKDYRTLLSKAEAKQRVIDEVKERGTKFLVIYNKFFSIFHFILGDKAKAARLLVDQKMEIAMRRLKGETLKVRLINIYFKNNITVGYCN